MSFSGLAIFFLSYRRSFRWILINLVGLFLHYKVLIELLYFFLLILLFIMLTSTLSTIISNQGVEYNKRVVFDKRVGAKNVIVRLIFVDSFYFICIQRFDLIVESIKRCDQTVMILWVLSELYIPYGKCGKFMQIILIVEFSVSVWNNLV